LREEVLGLFHTVSRNLDALCHFYFTPRPVTSEVSAKVLATHRALPALQLEDINPFNVNSQAVNQAPEDLIPKKRGRQIFLLKPEELGRDDRQKLRKLKKEKRRSEKRKIEATQSDEVKRKKLEDNRLKNDKRVTIAPSGENRTSQRGSSSQYTNSKHFFNTMQENGGQGNNLLDHKVKHHKTMNSKNLKLQ
jgi:hypothetical protein